MNALRDRSRLRASATPVGRATRPAHLLAFPILRTGLVDKIARSMKRRHSDEAAEEYLARELRRQTREMWASGISPAVVRREIRALEPAIRGALWRLIFGPLSGTGRGP
jgi:hypothetical protein